MNGTGNYFTVIAIIVLAAKKQVTYEVITRDNGGRAPLNKQFWHELWTADVESFLPVLVSSFTESLSIF